MKKLSLIYTLIITAGILFATYSCNDYLDVGVNNQLAIDEFYETDEDANQAVMAAYNILQWHVNIWGANWSSPYMVKTLPSDEGQAGGSGPGDQPAYVALDRLSFDATSGPVEGTWGVNYYGIYRCNLVIENVAPDSDFKKRAIAEARTLRAYYYLELVTLFGDVPLITTELEVEQYNQAKVNKSEVYAFIASELNAAIPELPNKSIYTQADRFRVTKGLAYALLGKAHLFQENWSESAAAFDAVIASGEYDLEPDFAKVFSQDGELGIESLFEAIYITTAGYDWGANSYPWGAAGESNVHIQLMGARETSFTGVDSLNNGWGFNYPSQKLWDAFINAGDEVRRKNTLMSEEEFIAAGGEVMETDVYDYQGFLRRKYGAYNGEGPGTGVFQVNYGTNWRLMRYADVLLMAAEAHYRTGNESQALIELNKIRTRAQLPEITESGDALFEAIVTERQLELALEGNRYLDLIRWGRAAAEIEGFVTGKHEFFPIPQNELLRASNLTQNTGY